MNDPLHVLLEGTSTKTIGIIVGTIAFLYVALVIHQIFI